MAEYILKRSLTLGLTSEEVFPFFADAGNLERITPPHLKFRILTPMPIDIRQGTLIDYVLSVRGIPIKWQTEISSWNPPFEFVDRQLVGPYKQWIHRHTFTQIEPNKTRIDDEVRYRLPFEPWGDIFSFMVKRELANIFDYRQRAVTELLQPKI